MPSKLINLCFKQSKTRIIHKITTTSDKGKEAITVDPKNPENRFYTKVEKNQLNNVFVKRLSNGRLKFYFFDIYLEENAYKQKIGEYL